MNKLKTKHASIRLSRREFMILRRVSFAAKRTGGRKLPAAVVLRALVRLLERLEVDFRDLDGVNDLTRRLLKARTRGGKNR